MRYTQSHPHRPLLQGLALLAVLLLSGATQAADETYTSFGQYKVFHSVFNSSFIKPDIASSYNLTRGSDQALVNIALIKTGADGQSNGLPAEVSGRVTNLMQQSKPLQFIEINEQNAVYYLAPLRFNNEEVLHFTIEVKHEGKTYDVKFSKKLYVD